MKEQKIGRGSEKNWGIKIELEEKASADHVAIEFETMKQKVNNTNKYMEIRRKRQSKSDERMLRKERKEYSIALLVYI